MRLILRPGVRHNSYVRTPEVEHWHTHAHEHFRPCSATTSDEMGRDSDENGPLAGHRGLAIGQPIPGITLILCHSNAPVHPIQL